MLVWPTADTVLRAAAVWARDAAAKHEAVLQIGYFGSYARGNAGVGSDLDIVVVINASDQPFERRAAQWDTTTLPVPADLLVYTAAEWRRFSEADTGFARTLRQETRWLFGDARSIG